jgi:hypothetical protein
MKKQIYDSIRAIEDNLEALEEVADAVDGEINLSYAVGFIEGLRYSVECEEQEDEEINTDAIVKEIISETVEVIAQEIAHNALTGYLNGAYTLEQATAVSEIAASLITVKIKFNATH